MNLHMKIMETIMIPFLDQCLQNINVYSYFKLLGARMAAIG